VLFRKYESINLKVYREKNGFFLRSYSRYNLFFSIENTKSLELTFDTILFDTSRNHSLSVGTFKQGTDMVVQISKPCSKNDRDSGTKFQILKLAHNQRSNLISKNLTSNNLKICLKIKAILETCTSQITNHQSPKTNHQKPITNNQ